MNIRSLSLMAISIILTSTLIYLNYHSNGRDSVAENRSPEPNGNIIDDQLATDNKQHLQSRHFSDNKETLPANLSSNPAAEIRPRRTPVRAVPSGHEELPVERTFLRDGQMYVDTVAATMKSDRFDEVLDQFEQQIQTDVLAMEMTSLYRGALQQHAAGFDHRRHDVVGPCNLGATVGDTAQVGGVSDVSVRQLRPPAGFRTDRAPLHVLRRSGNPGGHWKQSLIAGTAATDSPTSH
jgi:hypothetical protein